MGARGSLTIGISVSFLNITIGVIYGSICGYFGGLIDDIITRITEILISVPNVLVILLMSMILGPGLLSAIIAMSIVGWCNIARIVRGQIYQVKNQEYVLAAMALGANNERIIAKHLISNIIGITVVAITVEIPNTILNEIILTYIGFISAGSFMTWGNLCRNIGAALLVYPTQVYIPTFFICLTLACFNIIGDALSDALDPKIN
jgi:oligopeptide transport system permease protein